jgi:hypothetical protein
LLQTMRSKLPKNWRRFLKRNQGPICDNSLRTARMGLAAELLLIPP